MREHRWVVLCGLLGNMHLGTVPAAAQTAAVVAVDADGDTVRLARPAARVISLVPDATELMIALGAAPQLVGRTRFDQESTIATVPSVGGMVTPDLERITTLRPDFVIVGAGEKRAATREMIRRARVPVFAAPIRDTAGFFRSTAALGHLLGQDSAAAAVAGQVRAAFVAVHRGVAGRPVPTVAFVMPGNPPTTAGPRTYISELLAVAGGRNVFDDATSDWPKVSVEEIVRRAPAIVLVAESDSTGRAAAALRGAPGWRALSAARTGRIVAVPADLTERPGPRMPELARIFQHALESATPP